MDLMGSDAIQSEDAMREMWGDSIRAVKCQHARITYGDFLLLMKGQTRETPPSVDLDSELGATSLKPLSAGRPLQVVREGEPVSPEVLSPAESDVEDMGAIAQPDVTTTPSPINMANIDADLLKSAGLLPLRAHSPKSMVQSAPNTPAGHKQILDAAELESPFSMDDDSDIHVSGPGVPGTSASLTPPQSPLRRATDFCTPEIPNRYVLPISSGGNQNIMVPGLPEIPSRPENYVRRQRSRSVGDDKLSHTEEEAADLHTVADVVRDMIIPENGHLGFEHSIQSQKSNLVANRQLYRAHRQMRMAVMEASKRFEEQQTAHAREMILKEREEDADAGGFVQAGLVMRHGHHGHISSEAIRQLLSENRQQQETLVEKANRRGGRGRRSRKKTASDMSGMLNSMGQDELSLISSEAKTANDNSPPKVADHKSMFLSMPENEELVVEDDDVGSLRHATVPGQFRKTSDPFSKQGKYGAVYQE